jgi:Phage derived protein Gp49-like (DUF891)
MPEWTFRDYQRPTALPGNPLNEILLWTLGLPVKAQAKIDAVILSLQGFRVWPPQYVSDCGYEGIWELRIVSGGVQYRPLGCYGPGPRVFTLLIGTIEKGGKIPYGDGESAVQRRERVLKGWPTCEHEFTDTAFQQV